MKLQVLSTMVAFLVLTSARGDILLGNFEGSLDSGWTAINGATATAGTAGATLGSGAMKVVAPLNTFNWTLQYDNNSLIPLISASPVLAMDVTWVTSDWTGYDAAGAWARMDSVAINGDGTGWQQTTDAMMTDAQNPSYPGSWDPYNWGASNTRTLYYDLSSLLTGGSGVGADTWFQIQISMNMGGNFASDAYYIDNVRLVPEPATCALLGLGMLGLLVFRRRKA